MTTSTEGGAGPTRDWYPAHEIKEGATKEAIESPARPHEVDIPSAVFHEEMEAIQARRNYERTKDESEHEDKRVPALPTEALEAKTPSASFGLRGLCISGGGIRSATFSTGVAQALAGEDLLKHMDYLSTVSGGGYSGSMLTWALYGDVYAKKPDEDRDTDVEEFVKSFGTGPKTFPIGTDDPKVPRSALDDKDEERHYGYRLKLLNYVREHGKYLTPGGGITAWSGLAVLVRGVLLNLLVWVGLVTCLMLLTLVYFKSWSKGIAGIPLPCIGVTACILLIILFGVVLRKRFPIWGIAVSLAALVVLVTLWKAQDGYGVFRCLHPTLWLVLTGAGVCVLYGLLTFFGGLFDNKWLKWLFGDSNRRYGYRRYIENAANPYFVITILAVALGTLGYVADALRHMFGEAALGGTSFAMLGSGIASGIWTFAKSRSERDANKDKGDKKKSPIPIGLVASVGSILLLYGGLLGALALAEKAHPGVAAGWAWAGLGAVAVMGWIVNTNYISLGRFYRDRLMETFMPTIERALNDKTGAALEADARKLSAMWNSKKARGPYHIVNTNLVLVDSDVRKWRTRGGECFILSPFFCGSRATGWRRTKTFEQDTMTLSTAMAISGAAANPNAGVAGKGVTRNKFVSLLMSLLNFRLGSWVRHCERKRVLPPNHFWPGGAYELLGGYSENSRWLMLSDGGHFENLALYEMIRRRLKVIVVLDGGADPDFNFADLQNAMRLVAADFGARIDFGGAAQPLRDLSYKREEEPGFFPRYPGRAKTGFLRARIRYAGWRHDGDAEFEGDLIYIKTTLIHGLSLTTEGYRDIHPSFPDQTTADQFFDPEQFEAYRDLGYQIGKKAADTIRSALEGEAFSLDTAESREPPPPEA